VVDVILNDSSPETEIKESQLINEEALIESD